MEEKPKVGRTFSMKRRVSRDDANPTGRMEFDAIARFLQDVGNDDTDDAGMAELGMAWVARRAAIAVHTPASGRELLTLTTWCSGTGRRWAERRTSITGEAGAIIEAEAIWVHVDPTSGRPVPWGDAFSDSYLEASGGREVSTKLRHSKEIPSDASTSTWVFRRTDMDGFGHVNNAAYLAIAEEYLDLDAPATHIEIEWRTPSGAGEPLTVHSSNAGAANQLWVTATDGTLRVTITQTHT